MTRPDCFEFAMDFLGDPEEPEVRAYVESLEGRVKELEGAGTETMTTPINWTWIASTDPDKKSGQITLTCHSHSLTFEMKSFTEAGRLVRLIEQLQARAREECISVLMGYVHDGCVRARMGQ